MRRHATDGVSLTFGLLFLAITLWWLISRSVHVGLAAVAWGAAGGLLVLGVLGLLAAVRGRDRGADDG